MEKLEDYKKKYGEIYHKLYLIEDVQKSTNIYSDLYFFEVYLRYNVNKELTRVYGENWQDSDKDETENKNGYRELKYDKQLLNHFNITLDKMQEFNDKYDRKDKLSLGFWVKLFGKKFHERYINGTIDLKKIFPAIPLTDNINPEKKTRDIKEIHKDLMKICDFRNKIFHFEAEHLLPKIQEYKELIQKYIKYLGCDKVFLNTGGVPRYGTGESYLDDIQLESNAEREYINNIQKKYNNIDIINTILYDYIDFSCEDSANDCNIGIEKKIDICNNRIKIIVVKKNEDKSFYDNKIDNKTKFITTLEELPNLLNTIQNDNAN